MRDQQLLQHRPPLVYSLKHHVAGALWSYKKVSLQLGRKYCLKRWDYSLVGPSFDRFSIDRVVMFWNERPRAFLLLVVSPEKS